MNKPFALVAVGGVAWLIGGLALGGSLFDQFMLGLLGITLGFAAAAFVWERSHTLALGALAIAFVGIMVFLGRDLFSFRAIAFMGSHLFALGLMVAMAALFLRAGARMPLHRVGLALSALACAVWFLADLDTPQWQPGNVIVGAGLAWAVWRPTLPE